VLSRPRRRVPPGRLALAAGLLLLAIMFWHGWSRTLRVVPQNLAGLDVSIAWGYAAIPIGAVFSAVGALAHFLDRRSDELERAV